MPEDLTARRSGAAPGLAAVEETDRRGMITLRGDLVSKALVKAVKKIVGIDVPGQGKTHFSETSGVLWMSPDELLIFCPIGNVVETMAKLNAALAKMHALVVDVSDARVLFTLSGAGAREVLAKLTPADVSPDSFSTGMVRRSRLAQVPAAFWLDDEGTIGVICFRSVALYVFDLLSSAAAPGGEVGYFQT